jgi:Bacterial regulatory protein, arsR family
LTRLAQATVSQHLKVLKEAGLIRGRIDACRWRGKPRPFRHPGKSVCGVRNGSLLELRARYSRPRILQSTSTAICVVTASSIGERIRGRSRGPSWTAPAVDENAGRVSGGGIATHHDIDVADLLEVRIEDRFAVRAPALPGYLENQLFYVNS